MTIVIINKTLFSAGTFTGVKNIAYNEITKMYTITRSDDSTVSYSADTYYVSMLWT